MKKVLDQTFGKNGDVIKSFTPTAKMILFAMCKAKNGHMTDQEVCDEVGITQQALSVWRTKYGSFFSGWLEEMIDQYAPDKDAELLHAVGMVHAVQGNYNFWKDMAKSKGVIKEDVKNLTVNINTDFSHIGIGDFNEQRARLLSELRGVGQSGKSRVAEPSTIDITPGRESSGNRTSQVQDRSMALAHSLGSNRRQPRTRQPISAVSQQASPSDSNPLLAEHTEAPMPKK